MLLHLISNSNLDSSVESYYIAVVATITFNCKVLLDSFQVSAKKPKGPGRVGFHFSK